MKKTDSLRIESLEYHAKPRPGKIAIVPTKRHYTQRDLALAYSPGVAEPCLEIEKNKSDVYKYTNKGNVIAVISNGTAVLGLGDIGPEASKPVMEGKSLLFKIFADIDGIDIELDAKDVDKFVETVKAISPSFGGINLEDIKAPEAFEIERRLKEELDIPVMHDDQHGTAIISGAALINAVEIANKKIEEVYIVISGAGAAAISCSRLYKKLGVLPENMVMLDSKGVIQKDHPNLSEEKKEFATARKVSTLVEAIKGADVFIGLSKANILSVDMLKSMSPNPIVFAMANPDPEIGYDLAMSVRQDVIMATGRSDHPNQVNNVLGFPFIFRGALDVRATKINEEMKMAAVMALAELAKKTVPEEVNIAYGNTHLNFGRNYIIPKPFDPRLITEIPPAVAKAAMDSGVATKPIENWEHYKDDLRERMGTDNKLIRQLYSKAKSSPKRIVFPEAETLSVLKAAQIAYDEEICIPILLGNKDIISNLKKTIDFDVPVEIIDPKAKESAEACKRYAELLWKKRTRKGMTYDEAYRRVKGRSYFACGMVNSGDADGAVMGSTMRYKNAITPVLETIDLAEDSSLVSSTILMMTPKGPLFLSDPSVNVDPSAEALAQITRMASRIVSLFGIEPVIAMLSYVNFANGANAASKKVIDAVDLLHKSNPELLVDGGLQADFALNKALQESMFPFSKIAGKEVNTLIFPNLESANISYKLLKSFQKVEPVGPILEGLKKSVHVLPLGASVNEILNMIVVTVVDAQQKSGG